MDLGKPKEVKPPDAQPIADVVNLEAPWDYTHTELKNQTIVFTGYSEFETQYGNAFLADVIVDGQEVKVLIGGQVLMQQLAGCRGNFPVSATIIKEGRYYTFR